MYLSFMTSGPVPPELNHSNIKRPTKNTEKQTCILMDTPNAEIN